LHRGEQAKNDGILGQELVRSMVAGTGHRPQPIEDYIRAQLEKEPDRQSFRTTARGLRELFRILGFIDDSGETVEVADLGLRAAGFAGQPMNDEQIRFWRRAIQNMSHDGGDGEPSHPYQVLLKLIARKPGIAKPKCALALAARNDSPEELARIVALVNQPEARIRSILGVSKSNWANAVKVLPKFAEQLGDVVRSGPLGGYQYEIADAPGRADFNAVEPRPEAVAARPRRPAAPRYCPLCAVPAEPVPSNNRQRQHSAAQTHEQEKVQHVMKANKHYRCADELRVATTKSAPPEEQECDCEHRCARYQGMTGRYWIMSE